MKNAKRKKPKRTMPYIRAVLDRLTRRRWPDWKQQFAYEQLLWERFLWCGGDNRRMARSDSAATISAAKGSATTMQPEPIREWREQYARRYLRVDFEPLPGSAFHASVKPVLPELRIVRAALSPGLLFRDKDLLRDDDDRIGFVVAQSGKLTARHLGREVQLAPGDATMMLMSATGGVGWRETSVLFDMLIPPTEWEARGTRFEDVLMQRLCGKSDVMRLLRSYIRSLERSGLTTFGDNHTIVRRHVIDLTVLAASRHRSVGESSLSAVVAAHTHTIFDYLASHFSDPELSLSKVAQSVQISTRYLQRLLETSGTSFAAHVTELRLNHAFALLTAQGKSDVRICDVALQAGFSDISHFNRLFRSRFGDTPKGVRAHVRMGNGIGHLRMNSLDGAFAIDQELI